MSSKNTRNRKPTKTSSVKKKKHCRIVERHEIREEKRTIKNFKPCLQTLFDVLPSELKIEILKVLDVQSLISLFLTCRSLNRYILSIPKFYTLMKTKTHTFYFIKHFEQIFPLVHIEKIEVITPTVDLMIKKSDRTDFKFEFELETKFNSTNTDNNTVDDDMPNLVGYIPFMSDLNKLLLSITITITTIKIFLTQNSGEDSKILNYIPYSMMNEIHRSFKWIYIRYDKKSCMSEIELNFKEFVKNIETHKGYSLNKMNLRLQNTFEKYKIEQEFDSDSNSK